MCGFVGFLGTSPDHGVLGAESMLESMAGAIAHRGPDDHGVWCDLEAGIGLGHRRLAIIDISPAGHQPMVSQGGQLVLAFNGEIYNHADLRKELVDLGHGGAWRGHSDTETLLAGFEAWGVAATLERTIGMFAFALWDRVECTLTLGRDRMGEKPLYYGWQGSGANAIFLFGSELKAVRVHPAFVKTIDRGAISLLLRHNYIPAPYTIYEAMRKLPPGMLLTVSLRKREPELRTYWSAAQAALTGSANPFAGSSEQAVNQLEVLLKDAVKQQMMADVPLGAFLSGGVDSSTVVALMQAQSSRPVETFTIGFDDIEYDEAKYAKEVARHLGTAHNELYVSAREAQDVIPSLPSMYDEPFSDSSQIPTYLVSKLARTKVAVSLSGDAGDELFCGYNRYQMTARLWSKMAAVPLPMRRLGAAALTAVSAKRWNQLAGAMQRFLPSSARMVNTGDKLHKGAGVMQSASVEALYLGLVSHWPSPSDTVINGPEHATLLNTGVPQFEALGAVERMMALDMLTYLPDDILTKVDRAGMAVSLEGRVPFLDHRVVEFAWQLPQEFKLREGQTKWALRQVLYRHVPKEMIERPKMGFGVPIGEWLRGPLRDWAEALLDENRLREEGFFHPVKIREKWQEHLSSRRNWEYQLWDVLMFQAWLEDQ